MRSPILLLVFNRPDTTRQVFEEIRRAQPSKLYIAADGPRRDRASDVERCAEVIRIFELIDWPCAIKTLYREDNLGCKKAVSSAIDWFFEQEEEGIILEDDCLPSMSFFSYCDELLEKYRFDERVFIVSGYNRQNTWKTDKADYFFSNLGGIWGWGTWKRAWQHFDPDMNDLKDFTDQKMFDYLLGKEVGKMRASALLNVKIKHVDSWAFPWGFSRHLNSGMACVPSKNLVKNIGFGDDASNTFSALDSVSLHDMDFPLKPNNFVVADKDYDRLFISPSSYIRRIADKLSNLFSK